MILIAIEVVKDYQCTCVRARARARDQKYQVLCPQPKTMGWGAGRGGENGWGEGGWRRILPTRDSKQQTLAPQSTDVDAWPQLAIW